MLENACVRLDVALACSGDTIRGTIDDHAGEVVAFTGWLELMSGFDIVCARASGGALPEPASDPTDGR